MANTENAAATTAETAPSTSGDAGVAGYAGDAGVGGDADTHGSTSGEAERSDWDGQVSKLDGLDWYKSLEDMPRTDVKNGITAIAKGFQSSYTKKTQELASKRREVDARLQKAQEKEARALELLYGSEDPFKDAEAESDRLQTEHRKILDGLTADYENKLQEAERAREAAIFAVSKERDDAKARVSEYEKAAADAASAAEEAEKAAIKTKIEEVFQKLIERAPDIESNDDAFDEFAQLYTVYQDFDKALARTRVGYPALKAGASDVPAGLDLMSTTSAADIQNPSNQDEDFHTVFARERRKAQNEENARLRGGM